MGASARLADMQSHATDAVAGASSCVCQHVACRWTLLLFPLTIALPSSDGNHKCNYARGSSGKMQSLKVISPISAMILSQIE